MEFFLEPEPTTNIQNDYSYWRTPKKEKKPQVSAWMDRLYEQLSRDPNDQAAREDLSQICRMVIRRMRLWKLRTPGKEPWKIESAPFSNDIVVRIVTTCVDLDNESMFLEAQDVCSGEEPLSVFQSIGSAVLRYNLGKILPR
jgi:hypothetical protein